MASGIEYTLQQKENLAKRIEKIHKVKHVQHILDIIQECNPNIIITTTYTGMFLYFHNLKDETYHKLDKYIRGIQRRKHTLEYVKSYMQDDPSLDKKKYKYNNIEHEMVYQIKKDFMNS